MVKQVKLSSQKQVDISESTIINHFILMNRFYPVKTLIFIPEFVIQTSENPDICVKPY